MVSATLDGWPLTGATRLGGQARLLDASGWLGKSMRRTRLNNSSSDGDLPSAGLIDSRSVTLSGEIVYGDAVTAAVERRQMMAIGGRGTTELTIDDPAGTLTAFVEVDALSVTPYRDTMLSYVVTVTAPDPILYGPPLFTSTALSGSAGGAGLTFPATFPLDFGTAPGVTPGVVEVPNAGTETYWPQIRIDGPVPNPKVTVNETGDFLRLGFTLSASQWVDVDCGNRRVLLNGQSSITRYVTFSGNWLAIPPGGASMSITADAADPAASLSVFHYEGAWL